MVLTEWGLAQLWLPVVFMVIKFVGEESKIFLFANNSTSYPRSQAVCYVIGPSGSPYNLDGKLYIKWNKQSPHIYFKTWAKSYLFLLFSITSIFHYIYENFEYEK